MNRKTACFYLLLICSPVQSRKISKRSGISSDDVQEAVDFNFGVDALSGNLVARTSIAIFQTIGYSTAGKNAFF